MQNQFKHKYTLIVLLLLFLFSGCSNIPPEVEDTLNKAGELKKVIEHYKALGDDEKLEATYYLLKDIKYKYGKYPPDYDFYLSLSAKVDSFDNIWDCQDRIDKFIEKELNNYYNNRNRRQMPQIKYDIDIITSKFLISNIDMAFDVWKTKPWNKHISFDEFCEWILPYRVNNEPLQPWRLYFYKKLNKLEELVTTPNDPKNIGLLINNAIAKDLIFSPKLKVMPNYGGIDLSNLKIGVCRHRYTLITMAMRSMGVPVSIDFTYQYNIKKVGNHSWTVLLDRDGKIKPFNGGEKEIKFLEPAACPLQESVTTVFRQKYGINTNSLIFKSIKNLPTNFANPFIKEVTYQYVGNFNKNFDVKINNSENGNYAFLFTYTNGTKTQIVSYAKIKNGVAKFKNVGSKGIYFYKVLSNGRMKLPSQAFKISKNGKVIYITPDTVNVVEKMVLYRKFPQNVYNTLGAQIQGSNAANFLNEEIIYTMPERVNELKDISVNPTKKYRYYRYFAPYGAPDIKIAAIFLYSGIKGEKTVKGKIFGNISDKNTCDDSIFENAFDGNIRTNFNAPSGSWVAIDVGKPVKIVKIKVMPRSSFNIVEPGHTYELFYFNRGKWISLGKKVADDYNVVYNNTPTGALFLLRNLTTGIEERRFLYANNKQIWLPFIKEK